MPTDSPSPAPAARSSRGRRSLLRALTGGGAAAALTLSTARAAEAAPAGAADPFTTDRFRPSGRVREYWLQAGTYAHNVAPNGRDGMTGMKFTADQTTYQAIGYRAYTPKWGSPLPADHGPNGIGANSGVPGPVLRAEVGDVIRVHFRNNDAHYKWPHSIHPHGVRYTPDNDGGWMADDAKRPGTAVAYGDSYTYEWTCTPGSVGSWPYHDHAAPQAVAHAAATAPAASAPPSGAGHADAFSPGGPVMEIGAELGLFGMIAVTDHDTPQVDQEFVLFFHDLSSADAPSLKQDVSLCNGGAFVDNAPTFTARPGDRIRWRVGTLGNSFHVFHVHGHRWRTADGWVDSQVLGPATTLTVEYREDNPGDWLYHCHLPGHMMRGMAGRYRVTR
jgi:FtsP/CotA-like multicopper oxidase with cupredoxin domain